MGLKEYLSSLNNYLDMIYIWGSITNVLLQNTMSPFNFINKLLVTNIYLQMIYKTFFFLRIVDNLSYIVTMIANVFFDLRVFLLFYFILIIIFSMIFAVLGVGNPNVLGDFKDMYIEETDAGNWSDIPNVEYKKVGLVTGYFFSTLRMSLGDFDFGASEYLSV